MIRSPDTPTHLLSTSGAIACSVGDNEGLDEGSSSLDTGAA